MYLDAETGLYYDRARYYSPALGRFMQTDPMGYAPDLDMYTYVYNDPTNRVDPSGKCIEDACIMEITAVGAGAGILTQAGADLFSGHLSSFSTYAGAAAGGAAGIWTAVFTRSPYVTGGVSGAVSSLTTNAIDHHGLNQQDLKQALLDAGLGAAAGKLSNMLAGTAANAVGRNERMARMLIQRILNGDVKNISAATLAKIIAGLATPNMVPTAAAEGADRVAFPGNSHPGTAGCSSTNGTKCAGNN